MFGRYLIAAFHPRPIFANDERLQDPELASKTRFPCGGRIDIALDTLPMVKSGVAKCDKN